jgi:hypothetical protein
MFLELEHKKKKTKKIIVHINRIPIYYDSVIIILPLKKINNIDVGGILIFHKAINYYQIDQK